MKKLLYKPCQISNANEKWKMIKIKHFSETRNCEVKRHASHPLKAILPPALSKLFDHLINFYTSAMKSIIHSPSAFFLSTCIATGSRAFAEPI